MEGFRARPLGAFETFVDSKGRLRLPPAFRHSLGNLRIFLVTAVDDQQVRLYPRATSGVPNDSAAGWETEMDAEGRILLPSDVRRQASFAAAPVFLEFKRDYILLLPESAIKARREFATAGLRKALKTLRTNGLR